MLTGEESLGRRKGCGPAGVEGVEQCPFSEATVLKDGAREGMKQA